MSFNKLIVCAVFLIFAGCGSDLFPSADNKVPPEQTGTTGNQVGQNAPDFTLSDTERNSVTLSQALPSTGGVVLYFTMWCPICDTDMNEIMNSFMPSYPNVTFYAVDYVSGSVEQAASAQSSNGWSGTGFIVLADTAQDVMNLYNAGMSTTIVIDRNGVVRMNESYKSSRLQEVLAALP